MKTGNAPLIISLCALSACAEVRDLPSESDAAATDERDDDHSDDSDAQQVPAKDAGPRSEASAPSYDTPADWPRVTGNCGITLRAPALVATRSQGLDSCVASFQGPDCTYSADLGGFSDRLTRYDGPNYAVEMVSVAGQVARLVTSHERLENQRYFVAIHVPGPFWPDAPRVTLTVSASCFSETGRDTARNVLQTIELPEKNGYYPLPESTSCVGDDIQPIAGYRLGKACVDAKVEVPGICALGARANGSLGTGTMMCFVSPAGDYYWAHVAYGVHVAGPGSRHGGGQHTPSELTAVEEARCKMLVDALSDAGVANPVTGERSYGSCP